MSGRHPDWERRFADYVTSVARKPHIYGKHDCIMHPLNAAKAVTGKDHARGHRGKYKTASGALRYLKSLGFDTPEAALDSILDEGPIGFAQRGDIVLTPPNDETGWHIPGVVVGDVALCVAPHGLVPEPRARWLKAWKVGR